MQVGSQRVGGVGLLLTKVQNLLHVSVTHEYTQTRGSKKNCSYLRLLRFELVETLLLRRASLLLLRSQLPTQHPALQNAKQDWNAHAQNRWRHSSERRIVSNCTGSLAYKTESFLFSSLQHTQKSETMQSPIDDVQSLWSVCSNEKRIIYYSKWEKIVTLSFSLTDFTVKSTFDWKQFYALVKNRLLFDWNVIRFVGAVALFCFSLSNRCSFLQK